MLTSKVSQHTESFQRSTSTPVAHNPSEPTIAYKGGKILLTEGDSNWSNKLSLWIKERTSVGQIPLSKYLDTIGHLIGP